MTTVQVAESEIDETERLFRDYADAVAAEMASEHGRPIAKLAAIARLMQGPNPLNGKPHSASSAESAVETDAEYSAYLTQQRQLVRAKIEAQGVFVAARMRAQLAIAALMAEDVS
jgi:antitoxin (DNA-binding transcriptional repressor) of toxin-antitoxin stability system